MNHGITDEQAIHYLQGKIAHHTAQLEKWKKALEAVEGVIVGQPSREGTEKKTAPKKKSGGRKKTKKLNFGGRIVSILNKVNRPLRARDLHSKYKAVTGKKTAAQSFSGQLSQFCRDSDAVKKYALPKATRQNKYWYVKAEWLDGKGKLKPDYVSKIQA